MLEYFSRADLIFLMVILSFLSGFSWSTIRLPFFCMLGVCAAFLFATYYLVANVIIVFAYIKLLTVPLLMALAVAVTCFMAAGYMIPAPQKNIWFPLLTIGVIAVGSATVVLYLG